MAERTGLEPATPGVTGRYSNQLNYRSEDLLVIIQSTLSRKSGTRLALGALIKILSYYFCCKQMARLTGLEPATPGVTGRYSNQLSYNRASHKAWLAV